MASVRKRKWTHNGIEKTAWQVTYKDSQTGKRKTGSFDKKKDADAFKSKVEIEEKAGNSLERSNEPLRATAEEFLRYQETRVKDGRIGRTRYEHFRLSIDSMLPMMGHKKPFDFAPRDAEEIYERLCKEGGLLPQTAKERLYVLQQVFRFAKYRQWFSSSSVDDALGRLKGIERRVIRTFSREEVAQLLDGNAQRGFREHERVHLLRKCVIHLAAFCGLRKGEIAGLTVDNVDLEGRLIRVRHSLTIFDVLKGPKTRAGRRDVPMPAHLAEMLGEWMGRHYIENDRRLVFRSKAQTCKQVGRSDYARKGTDTQFLSGFTYDFWYPALKHAGLWKETGDNLHFHALRHFAASYWLALGMPLADVAALLGHATFDKTLQVYAHPIATQDARRGIVDRAAEACLVTRPAAALPKPTRQESDMAA